MLSKIFRKIRINYFYIFSYKILYLLIFFYNLLIKIFILNLYKNLLKKQ